MEKETLSAEGLESRIQQMRDDIKRLAADRNAILYESLKQMIGKYYKNKFRNDQFFYVDAIGKETLRPLGYEIEYKSIRQSVIDIPGHWEEITKEDYEKVFSSEVNRLRKEMGL